MSFIIGSDSIYIDNHNSSRYVLSVSTKNDPPLMCRYINTPDISPTDDILHCRNSDIGGSE